MNFFNHEGLGFAATPQEAAKIIWDTGIFYLSLSLAYLLSFLYMICHSSSARKMKKKHYFGISLWAFGGLSLMLMPSFFSFFVNFLAMILAFLILCQLYFTSSLAAQINPSFSSIATDDKKALYAQTLLKKMDCALTDMLGFTLINEQILWLLILYRAMIGLRASFGLQIG